LVRLVCRAFLAASAKKARAIFGATDKYERGNETQIKQIDEKPCRSTRKPKNERFWAEQII
jgi:hypothetical protein